MQGVADSGSGFVSAPAEASSHAVSDSVTANKTSADSFDAGASVASSSGAGMQDSVSAQSDARQVVHAEGVARQLSEALGDKFVPEIRAADGTWNDDRLKSLLTEVTKLEPEAVAKLEPEVRQGLVENASKFVEMAESGSVGSGLFRMEVAGDLRQDLDRARDVRDTISSLAGPTDADFSKLDRKVEAPGVAPELTHGAAMEAHAGMKSEQAGSSISAAAMGDSEASKIARAAIDGAYGRDAMTDQYMGRLVREANKLDDLEIKSLPPETQGRLMAAMDAITNTMREAEISGVQFDQRTQRAMDSMRTRVDVFLESPGNADLMDKAQDDLRHALDRQGGSGREGSRDEHNGESQKQTQKQMEMGERER